MCGRYVPPDEAALERFWKIARKNWRAWIEPVFNLAPTTQVPILVRADDGALELFCARWGLIPPWWKKDIPPSLTFNARSEEARQKPTWRHGLRAQRCLMPARGWYEWNENEPVRNESGRTVNQPYFLYSPNAEVIAFAGIWAVWESPTGPVISCALLSKAAAPSIAHIHHRMPVVLAPEQYDTWLSQAATEAEVDAAIAKARQDFAGHRVSTRVNNTRNNSPALIEAVAAQTGTVAQAKPPATKRRSASKVDLNNSLF
jgi:putative SOS response-associated peptidase YedK